MRRVILAALAVLAAATAAHAGYGAGNPRLAKLYSSFMAPCCYGGDLTTHDSPKATELRARIAGMVQQGQTDEQIKSAMVAEYGKQILTVPEGPAGSWLFWVPPLIVLAGLFLVVWLLKRMRHAGPEDHLEAGTPA